MNHAPTSPNQPNRQAATKTGIQMRQLIERANITQARAAELSHCSLRTMQDWLNGTYPIPPAAAELLALAVVAHGYATPGPWLAEWLPPELQALAIRGAPL
ncbi:hypothetical protein BurJ1DRAFT_2547 [Burkholderiales bacterium JOSHI_001]|nr:hypothetical protein BurJ1DRAFT_2547 [Burkholderiales bacterium JOSHI_001]